MFPRAPAFEQKSLYPQERNPLRETQDKIVLSPAALPGDRRFDEMPASKARWAHRSASWAADSREPRLTPRRVAG